MFIWILASNRFSAGSSFETAYCKVEKKNVKATVIELIPLLSSLPHFSSIHLILVHEGEANSTKSRNNNSTVKCSYALPFRDIRGQIQTRPLFEIQHPVTNAFIKWFKTCTVIKRCFAHADIFGIRDLYDR